MVIIRLPAVDRSLHGYPDAREEVDGLSTLTSFNTVSIIHQSFFFLLFFFGRLLMEMTWLLLGLRRNVFRDTYQLEEEEIRRR